MRILVTGAAGFIGFHLLRFLRKSTDAKLLGVDVFTDYYDPNLKILRKDILQQEGIEVVKEDIANYEPFFKVASDFEPTHIIHLAAQAGVRYSLDNPWAYTHANINGFLSILETCRHLPKTRLIYASSSSVYGHCQTPFQEDIKTDSPVSLYGATKKSNELMAHSYHDLFKIPMIGLRFFTVYGPYGRPDMAYYSFTQKISRGESIAVFNHGKMERDFTYIDDIVPAIAGCLTLDKDFEVYNLGNNQPAALMRMIEAIEKELNLEAKLQMLPMQKGDVKATFANIDKAKRDLDFNPKVSIEEGIKNFVSWYKEKEPELQVSR